MSNRQVQRKYWVSPKLSYDIQEAVVGHELGHIFQQCYNYPYIVSPRNIKGNPLIPKLSNLGSMINSFVLDPGAEQWAIEHGFKVVDAIKSNEMRMSLAEIIEIFKPNGLEAANWSKFYHALNEISNNISQYFSTSKVLVLEPEIDTLINSIGFAQSNIYATTYGLWSELYFDLKREFPVATTKGYKIASIIEYIDFNSPEECQFAMIAVLDYLEIPSTLMYVDRPFNYINNGRK